MKFLALTAVCLLIAQAASAKARTEELSSPDGMLKIAVEIGERIAYSVSHAGTEVVALSPVSMRLSSGIVWGQNPAVQGIKRTERIARIAPPLYKRAEINAAYRELSIRCKGDYSITFRAYNQGVAYRFATTAKGEIKVAEEEVLLNFSSDYQAIVPYVRDFNPEKPEAQFWNSFENTYTTKKLSELQSKRLIFLPLVVSLNDGKRLCFTEADLESYPGLYLTATGGAALKGVNAPYPKSIEQGGHNMLQGLVTEREDYIAVSKGARTYPWRVLTVSANDRELLDNDLVYALAAPSRIDNTEWIKPGKVAWDWWNDWNIDGVDFRTGVNNRTYQYYIDFAAKHGIEYVILDEGWAVNKKADLLQVVPEINIKELVEYGKSRNVGIILWAGYWAVNRDMENVFKHYSEIGVKGFKVDFMDRDDQPMVEFYYRSAETAARYRMLLDFHGAYKPTGLHCTWPNVVNFEGVHGLEQMKWSGMDVDQVTYDVTIPFIRMLAGPMDYTQGAMRNATRANYRPVNSEPMSQGTRCHQLAEYIIFESPLNMLCDNPSNYMREPECTAFIAETPTVWEQTVALDGTIGEYAVIARKSKNGTWYVGGLTNWKKRDYTVDLSFLDNANYGMTVFADGINADRVARDYTAKYYDLPADRKVKVTMMSGGGFVLKITPVLKGTK
ncbi:MAG: glycoside hydrolase family 97 protein [Bacteroidales bacterium]|jgi:alpha-glucosidase|nr:glycoside hydrolase family 97 protein [Bacteroidales bacterium]